MKNEKIIHFFSGLDNEVSVSMQKENLFHVIWPFFLQTQTRHPQMVAVALTAAPTRDIAARGKLWSEFTCLSQPCSMLILLHRGFFGGQRTTRHQTLLTFFLEENINSWTPPKDSDKNNTLNSHWLRICGSNDFAEYLQSVFLLGILPSIAFQWVFTVHKVKSVSFPLQAQRLIQEKCRTKSPIQSTLRCKSSTFYLPFIWA